MPKAELYGNDKMRIIVYNYATALQNHIMKRYRKASGSGLV
ncbi:MAG: hypothetical protein PHX51_07440 [Clostridia bacterium]|nr:hypothetical protein [Clostridia bacterium]